MRDFIHTSTALAAALSLGSLAAASPSPSAQDSAQTGSTYASSFDITTSWGNLSPYKDAKGFGVPNGVPKGCELSQAHILHRHGERFPTGYPLDGQGMEDFARKLARYSKAHPNSTVGKGPLEFLNDWKYMLGEDTLLATGATTEATSGANFWNKYGRLLYRAGPDVAAWNDSLNVYPNGTARARPVFRTTSQPRILESAKAWLSGFFGISDASSYVPYDLVTIPEVDPFNNTLASYDSCPGDMSEGDKAAKTFIPKYTKDAVTRLSAYLPTSFNLTAFDVLAMQNLCAYETSSFGGSSFCSLFTEQEWLDFAYNIDLQFYGDYGYGSPSGRAQGIGYVLELAARLEAKLITSSDTSINVTYDDNTAQFPLDQPFYLDMSHDDIIVSVLTALGLDYFRYSSKSGLPSNVDHAPSDRTFNTSEITPFGARFISEVWTCPGNKTSFDNLVPVLYQNPDLSSVPVKTDYIRFVLNGAPLPLDGLAGCEGSKNGFCAVKDFLSGVPTLKKDAMYQKACFGNYTVGGQVANGQPLSSRH